ncbi:MAG: hypothetical protein KJ066_13130 [Acidobacteria bacterium]|nr:hypothetical protein [Acidobacteriota bacterium]
MPLVDLASEPPSIRTSRSGLVLDPPRHTGVAAGPAPFKSEAELLQWVAWVALFPAGTTFRWWYSRAPTSDLFESEWWGDDAARCLESVRALVEKRGMALVRRW